MSLTELEQPFSRGFDFELRIGISDDSAEVGSWVGVLRQSTELTLGLEDSDSAQDGFDAVARERGGETVVRIGNIEAL